MALPPSPPLAQIVFFHSLIIGFHLLLPSLHNAIKGPDYSSMCSSQQNSFSLPTAHSPVHAVLF